MNLDVKIKYPDMRLNLMASMETLADPMKQHRHWVLKEFERQGQYEDFDLVVMILFDFCGFMDPYPQDCIGLFIVDERELVLALEVVKAIDKIFNKYGTKLTDEQYIALPEWPTVINAAKEFLDYAKTASHDD